MRIVIDPYIKDIDKQGDASDTSGTTILIRNPSRLKKRKLVVKADGDFGSDVTVDAKVQEDAAFGGSFSDISGAAITQLTAAGEESVEFLPAIVYSDSPHLGTNKNELTTEAIKVLVEYGGSAAGSVNVRIALVIESQDGVISMFDVGTSPDLFDAAKGIFTSDVEGWVTIEGNTLAHDATALSLKSTYVDNPGGASLILKDATDLSADLIVGKEYKITCRAKYSGGSAGVGLAVIHQDAPAFDTGSDVFTTGTYAWTLAGTNTIANVSNALAITYVDDATGATWIMKDAADLDADLVVGQRYRFSCDAKYAGGSAGVGLTVKPKTAAAVNDNIDLTTSLVHHAIDFVADDVDEVQVQLHDMAASNVVTLDNLKLEKLDVGTEGTLGVPVALSTDWATHTITFTATATDTNELSFAGMVASNVAHIDTITIERTDNVNQSIDTFLGI